MVVVWVCHLAGDGSWLSFLHETMELWFQLHAHSNQWKVNVRISAVVGSGVVDTVEGVMLSQDQVQLMPVF